MAATRSAATAQTEGKTTAVGVVVLEAAKVGVVATTVGVAAATVWVAAPTTAVEEAAATRLGLGQVVVELDAVRVAASEEATGAVSPALGAVTVYGGTGREAVHMGMAHRPPSARLRPRARSDLGGGEKASDSLLGGCCVLRQAPEQTACD